MTLALFPHKVQFGLEKRKKVISSGGPQERYKILLNSFSVLFLQSPHRMDEDRTQNLWVDLQAKFALPLNSLLNQFLKPLGKLPDERESCWHAMDITLRDTFWDWLTLFFCRSWWMLFRSFAICKSWCVSPF